MGVPGDCRNIGGMFARWDGLHCTISQNDGLEVNKRCSLRQHCKCISEIASEHNVIRELFVRRSSCAGSVWKTRRRSGESIPT